MTAILAAILGAIVGALAVGGFDLHKRRLERQDKASAVKAALVGEISAVQYILHDGGFEATLEAAIEAGDHEVQLLVIDIRSDFFTAYHALAPDVGMLDVRSARLITLFYTTAKNFIDITRPDSIAAASPTATSARNNNRQALSTLRKLMVLADKVLVDAGETRELQKKKNPQKLVG